MKKVVSFNDILNFKILKTYVESFEHISSLDSISKTLSSINTTRKKYT